MRSLPPNRADVQALPDPYRCFWEEARAALPEDRLFCDPLRTLAYGTDASFYRLVPRIVARVRNVPRGAGARRRGAAAPHAAHLPRGRHEPLRPGGHGLGPRPARRLEAARASRTAAPRVVLEPGVVGAEANALLAPLGQEDRPGPRVDRHLPDRRHRREQRERDVLRHGPEQLPDRPRDEARPRRRDLPRHRRRGVAQRLRRDPRAAARRARRAARGDPGGRAARPPHPREVPDQEHHRATGSTPSSTSRTRSTSSCTSSSARRGRSPSSPR